MADHQNFIRVRGAREHNLKDVSVDIPRGELVVIPTDTVYGIAADAFSHDAVRRLLDAKGRGREMPPPVLVSAATTLDERLAALWRNVADPPSDGRWLALEHELWRYAARNDEARHVAFGIVSLGGKAGTGKSALALCAGCKSPPQVESKAEAELLALAANDSALAVTAIRPPV